MTAPRKSTSDCATPRPPSRQACQAKAKNKPANHRFFCARFPPKTCLILFFAALIFIGFLWCSVIWVLDKTQENKTNKSKVYAIFH